MQISLSLIYPQVTHIKQNRIRENNFAANSFHVRIKPTSLSSWYVTFAGKYFSTYHQASCSKVRTNQKKSSKYTSIFQIKVRIARKKELFFLGARKILPKTVCLWTFHVITIRLPDILSMDDLPTKHYSANKSTQRLQPPPRQLISQTDICNVSMVLQITTENPSIRLILNQSYPKHFTKSHSQFAE